MISTGEFQRLAPQFKCPLGPQGIEVGRNMDELNSPQNDWVLTLLGFQPTDRVLEIGFGTGKTLKKVAQIVTQGRIVGMELSDTMIQEATQFLKDEVSQGLIELLKGDSTKLPLPDNSINKSYAVHVVYFWDNLPQVFGELNRVTEKGGIAAIYFVSPILAPTPEFHEYKQEELVKYLLSSGYNETQIKRKNFGEQNGICVIAKK